MSIENTKKTVVGNPDKNKAWKEFTKNAPFVSFKNPIMEPEIIPPPYKHGETITLKGVTGQYFNWWMTDDGMKIGVISDNKVCEILIPNEELK